MGIPKFYRWTSERYPCLSERIKEYQIPEFDNLYLDMNGIIHNCSHPNDEDVHLRIPEKQIFKDIFHYIDFLFKMIKPRKVFFMAVDGVAPRAKMNQQRGRRFRSARLAKDQEAEALKNGEILPSEERFDSNCITPGTEFMARLHEQLKYFVQVKVSTDPLWQREGLVIYLSGHDVPGEGEHKIMDFIRHIRSQADYVPVRHCLYGLDADLIMLGLSTHELHFSLLREEVKFSRPKKPKKRKTPIPIKSERPETSNYDLSNVTLFRVDDNLQVSDQNANETTKDANSLSVSSFAKIPRTPLETATITTTEDSESNKETKESSDVQVPPPADDSKAKGAYKAPLPEKTTFLLLHLSLMRDYIDFEFQELKENASVEYDLEKIIDDWILMNILVGNDFVPHLPNLHIVKGALPMLYRVYMDVLPELDGYINENGKLHLPRFEVFLKQLSSFDLDAFRETYDDMKYMESKTGKNIVLGEKMFQGFEFEQEDNFKEEELQPLSAELQALAERTEEEVFGDLSKETEKGNICSEIFKTEEHNFDDSEDSPEFHLEFLQHKRNYYINKLDVNEINSEFLEMFCKEYIRAIQWVLFYYYKGVCSWGWFYPFHYAPFCSDLKNFATFDIQFSKGQPFKPFEQLLAVLPSQSKKLLPPCYRWLMTDTNSPILDFYPEKFEQDLNGKKQDWEAVVLIPFIDESKLLDVMEKEVNNLNPEELHRNSKGSLLLYRFSSKETGVISSPGDLFPTLESGRVSIDTMKEVNYNPSLLPLGLHPKSQNDVIYQGFPSLKSKDVKAVIEKADIKVFEFNTREESMVLSLAHVCDKPDDIFSLAKQIVGRPIWVNWPHLTYAFVTSIISRQGKFFFNRGIIVKDTRLVESRLEKEFENIAKTLSQRHLKCKGIKLGDVSVIVIAKMMEGRKVRCDHSGKVNFETQWSVLEQPFPLKTCMYQENVMEIFYLDQKLASSYVDLYQVGDQVFSMSRKLFGTLGTVVSHDFSKRLVSVKWHIVNDSEERNLKDCVGRNTLKSHDYFSSHVAAGKCQISSYVLSRITGTVFISIDKEVKAQKKLEARQNLKNAFDGDGNFSSSDSSEEEFPALEIRKVNVGLDLKFNRRNMEVRGYTSKRDGIWYYSGKAIKLVNEYVLQFSDFVEFLTKCDKGRDGFDASEIFPQSPLEKVNEMADWLENKGIRDLPRIATNTNLLDDEDINSVWQYVLKYKIPKETPTFKIWRERPHLLLKPGLDRGCVPAISNTKYEILDRVVCIDRGAPLAVGHRGTVVGIQAPQASEPEQIEESFRSTGAATLTTLIVLCDPSPDIFDKPEDFACLSGHSLEYHKLSGALVNFLRINSDPSVIENGSTEAPKSKFANAKPRLVKLYPYQVLNLTEGPLHENDYGRSIQHLEKLSLVPKRKSESVHNPQNNNGPVCVPTILQRPKPGASNSNIKKPVEFYDSKKSHQVSAESLLRSVVNSSEKCCTNNVQPVSSTSGEARRTDKTATELFKQLMWPPKPMEKNLVDCVTGFASRDMIPPPKVGCAISPRKHSGGQEFESRGPGPSNNSNNRRGNGSDILQLLTSKVTVNHPQPPLPQPPSSWLSKKNTTGSAAISRMDVSTYFVPTQVSRKNAPPRKPGGKHRNDTNFKGKSQCGNQKSDNRQSTSTDSNPNSAYAQGENRKSTKPENSDNIGNVPPDKNFKPVANHSQPHKKPNSRRMAANFGGFQG